MMKKIATYIFGFFAILLILVSSTGISFVIHHCSENHTSEFHLFTSDYQCDHEKSESCCCSSKHNSSEDDCCGNINKHKSCSNTKVFIKLTDKYESLRYQFKFNTEVTNEVLISEPTDFTYFSIKKYFTHYNPPPLFSGTDILTKLSQFII